MSGAVTALPLISSNSFGRASVGGTSSNTFGGKGATESSNDFSGTITVLVTGVLPNGHLMIQGEKQIGVNANVDVLRFSGQVDPRAIQPGNSVPLDADRQCARRAPQPRPAGRRAGDGLAVALLPVGDADMSDSLERLMRVAIGFAVLLPRCGGP